MSNSTQRLPRFKQPPVVETVLGVFFRPLADFTSAHQGLLWERFFRSRFPTLEEHPPVPEVTERFGEERFDSGKPRWHISQRPDPLRLWAASEHGQHVIQVQKNAIFANWRKTDGEVPYRPYAERRQEFSQQLEQVDQFFREEGMGRLEPTSWSVTYINHFECGRLEEVGQTAARTITVWTNEFSDNWLPRPDRVIMDLAFPMPDNAGRLNVNLKPVVKRETKTPLLRLDLTARGRPKAKHLQSALDGIDLGHEWIVRGFASLTRPEMHGVWERIQ